MTKNTVELYFRSTIHHDSWYADWTHDSAGSVVTIRVDDSLPRTASDKQLIFLANAEFARKEYASEYRTADKTFVIAR